MYLLTIANQLFFPVLITIFDCRWGSGTNGVPAVDPVDAAHGAPRAEDHPQDHHDAEQDEGAGPEGAVLQVAAGQRTRHGRRLQAVLGRAAGALAHPPARAAAAAAAVGRRRGRPAGGARRPRGAPRSGRRGGRRCHHADAR